MMYEHVLRLPLPDADLVRFDAAASLRRARAMLAGRHDVDVRRVTRMPSDPAVVVIVHLPGDELPGGELISLMLRALGLAGPLTGPVTWMAPPELASEHMHGGGTFGGGSLPGRVLPPPEYMPPPQPRPPRQPPAPPPPQPGAPPAPAAPPPGPVRRYLHGQSPEQVRPGRVFSVLVRIAGEPPPAGGQLLKDFDVLAQGTNVLLVLHAPGFDVLNEERQQLQVPQAGDSEPARFDLRAARPGPRPVSVTAWHHGSYLGELRIEITVDPEGRDGPGQDVLGDVAIRPEPGAVGLAVRYVPDTRTYRFEFHDVDIPSEVTSNLVYEPGPRVEQLITELDRLARGQAGFSADETRDYLRNAGAQLWHELIPQRLRNQFWDRQNRIRQLTILTENDIVPWELLYPLDPGHDDGFLVEQFPVVRGIFARVPTGQLRLRPAAFVLPDRSPPQAGQEIDAVRALFGARAVSGDIVRELTPLRQLVDRGDFGVLHFACHNSFDPANGGSIRFGDARFTPTLLTTAEITKTLGGRGPLVFVNACRSGGLNISYNGMDGFARKFLATGASTFIGSLWAVVDDTAREFASTLYGGLLGGATLGDAVLQARRQAASRPGDPSWLAYSIYGDPSATVMKG
jgi:CHAT domain-containing protein